QTLYRYQYDNHLGSVCLELDDAARIISYEEYHPYGTSAYRAVKSGVEAPPSRYRYTGMERDEESGLDYHGARFLNASKGVWISPDPSGVSEGPHLYACCRNNPIIYTDESGRSPLCSIASTVETGTRFKPNTSWTRRFWKAAEEATIKMAELA